jgi:hypothetical protein
VERAGEGSPKVVSPNLLTKFSCSSEHKNQDRSRRKDVGTYGAKVRASSDSFLNFAEGCGSTEGDSRLFLWLRDAKDPPIIFFC